MQRRVVAALHDDQRIARKVLAGDKPGRGYAVLQSTDADSAPLPERVARESPVPADDRAFRRLDRTALARQPGLQECAERAFPDEADAGRVALVVDRQSALARECAHFRLAKTADRKIAGRELCRRHHVQEITLVLVGIGAAQQPAAGADSRVMPGRKPFGAQAPRIGKAQAELDLAIAQHVGIRRAPGAQFREEVGKDAIPVFRREADTMQRDSKLGAARACILEIGRGRAITLAVILPVRHEQALDIVPGIGEQ